MARHAIHPVRGCCHQSGPHTAREFGMSSCLAHTGLIVCCYAVERLAYCRSDCGHAVRHSLSLRISDGGGVTRERRHASGLTIQLSQSQGRQPLVPEGAPPAAGVPRLKAAVA